MLVSFLLRLVPDALADGELVGQVEAVDTGQVLAIKNVHDLVAFCCQGSEPASAAATEAEGGL